jgi:hypothetical protein
MVFESSRMLNCLLLKELAYVSLQRSIIFFKAKSIQHTSLPTYNKCFLAKIGDYLINGTLPGMANYCTLESGPWNVTINATLAGNNEVLRISGQLKALREK